MANDLHNVTGVINARSKGGISAVTRLPHTSKAKQKKQFCSWGNKP